MTKTSDIILDRVKQKLCPVCGAEFKAEWKDRFKAVQYKEQAMPICKRHPAPAEK